MGVEALREAQSRGEASPAQNEDPGRESAAHVGLEGMGLLNKARGRARGARRIIHGSASGGGDMGHVLDPDA